jgi:hypothetical protein
MFQPAYHSSPIHAKIKVEPTMGASTVKEESLSEEPEHEPSVIDTIIQYQNTEQSHICMHVLTFSSLAVSSCPYRRVEMELNRQFQSAFILSGVPISRLRLCRYITLTVSTGFECRGGRLSVTVVTHYENNNGNNNTN